MGVPTGTATGTISSWDIPSFDMSDYIQPTDPMVQKVVRQVAKYPLGRYLVYNVKALYYWLAFNIRYMPDEDRWGQEDYWQLPGTTINLGTGDCEDQAILLASLIRALGYPRDCVQISCGPVKRIWDGLVGDHAWIEIRSPNPTGTSLALSANESVTELEGRDVRRYQKGLVEILREGRVVSSDEILSRLRINPSELEAVKAVSKQLENLESYGIVKSSPKGWRWIEQ